MLRLGALASISFLFTGLATLLPISLARVSSPLSLDGIEITFSRTGVVLPCLCLKRSTSGDGRVSVHAATDTNVPLNYNYSVTGGRIIGEGPDVVWDFNDGFAPGEYSLTLVVDDGVGTYSSSVTKTISVVEPDCDCPCDCPSIAVYSHNTQVKRGGKLDFEARVSGGSAVNIWYKWTVENGVIVSGQGTPTIDVIASSKNSAVAVTAHLELVLDYDCGCLKSESESVRIGSKTVVKKLTTTVSQLRLDETTISLPCQPGFRPVEGAKVSKDPVVEVRTFAEAGTLRDKLIFTYSVSGGRILGSGPVVKWDLTDLAPGTYDIAVRVGDSDGVSNTQNNQVKVVEIDCGGDIECPYISLSVPERIGITNDFILTGNVSGGSTGTVGYLWSATGAEIIAGSGSATVRVRVPITGSDTEPVITLKLDVPPIFSTCPLTKSIFISSRAHP
jgi:hypothetical protein